MKTILLMFGIVLLSTMQLVLAEPEPEPSPECKSGTIVVNDDCVVFDGFCGENATYQDGICVTNQTENVNSNPSDKWGDPYTTPPVITEQTKTIGDDAPFFGIFVYLDNLISWIFGK